MTRLALAGNCGAIAPVLAPKARALPPLLTLSASYTYIATGQTWWRSKSPLWDWDHAKSWQQAQLGGEIGTAALELDATRLIAGRRAPHGCGDVGVAQTQAVAAMCGRRLRSEPGLVERSIQEIAAAVAPLNTELATLRDEIALCRQYLELERLRLSERLRVFGRVVRLAFELLGQGVAGERDAVGLERTGARGE